MSLEISAICTDIDGTLLDSQRQLSQQTIATVKRLENKIPFVLASSRMPAAMRHLQAELGILKDPLIAFNGGYVIQYIEGNDTPVVYDSVEIPVSIVAAIVELTNGREVSVSLYNRDDWYAPARDYWTEREEKITKVTSVIKAPAEVIELWKTNGKGAHKVMCMGKEQQIDFIERELNNRFPNDLHNYRSRPTYLEIAPKAISKGSALEMIMKKLYGKSLERVMSFGDNYNDIEMLRMSGIGIAVSNARREVLDVASEVTDKSTDDGVAKSIAKYCFNA
ncbi:HAD family hydrolase [Pseudochryseolinea flava]|uniref:Cof-type HAD-IIB family hydrolase n=1 Tax=Pseudochryseolinea flava TaxID=2059302 RepID=A0A364XWZ7_9BACT|nr:HAD family hydrolase [Pseudochryseolinea flava]RAV98723.1 Cof-type HAD-IIB family hydrolase [Pseudochryseolinea flava]